MEIQLVLPIEDVQTPLHVRQCISDCNYFNNTGKTWAEMEVVPTPIGTICRLFVGDIIGGMRMKKYATARYEVVNGNVVITKHTHA